MDRNDWLLILGFDSVTEWDLNTLVQQMTTDILLGMMDTVSYPIEYMHMQ